MRQLQEEAGTLRRASEHHSERLRIEIVTLRERLDEEEAARARLQGVLEAQLGAQREESRKGVAGGMGTMVGEGKGLVEAGKWVGLGVSWQVKHPPLAVTLSLFSPPAPSRGSIAPACRSHGG